MKVLVLGASGMIGHTVFRVLSAVPGWEVSGSWRSQPPPACLAATPPGRLIGPVDLGTADGLPALFAQHRPDVVINCAGLTKHLPEGNQPLPALLLNAVLPQRLAQLCRISGARLVQISTDCVFSGRRGRYTEADVADAEDLYGRSKALGEVSGPGLLTLRTSTIGHEWRTRHGLLEWFLAQRACAGYTRALFSGLPTVVFAQVLRDFVLPNPALEGLYHVAGEPIAKAELLRLIAARYGHAVSITPDAAVAVDRTLDGRRFAAATGFKAAPWADWIAAMHTDYLTAGYTHV